MQPTNPSEQPNPNITPESSPAQLEANPAANAEPKPPTPPQQQPSVVQDQPTAPPVAPAMPAQQSSTSPTQDATEPTDVELIDNSYVQRAEDIISQNKDNPKQEELEEEKLKNEYLKKQFNFEIDKSE